MLFMYIIYKYILHNMWGVDVFTKWMGRIVSLCTSNHQDICFKYLIFYLSVLSLKKIHYIYADHIIYFLSSGNV